MYFVYVLGTENFSRDIEMMLGRGLPVLIRLSLCFLTPIILLVCIFQMSISDLLKVLRPSGPNYWRNVELIPYVFCKEYCSECQNNRVMGQKFGTITFCHLLKEFFSEYSHRTQC